jgi:hypothetical protein
MFTIHGDDTTPVERLCSDAVKRVVLTYEAIQEARDFLETANINEYTIFPDLAGIADYLKRTFFKLD